VILGQCRPAMRRHAGCRDAIGAALLSATTLGRGGGGSRGNVHLDVAKGYWSGGTRRAVALTTTRSPRFAHGQYAHCVQAIPACGRRAAAVSAERR